MTTDRIGESMYFAVDLDLDDAARVVEERLGVALEVRVDLYGLKEYEGSYVDGARLWMQGSSPATLWVWATLRGEEIRTALVGAQVRLDRVMPGPTRERVHRRDAWRRLLDELRAEGWRIEMNGDGDGLIQAEGFLPTGQEFYLNFKYDTCYLEVGSTPEEWSAHEVPYPRAGYLEADEAVLMLRELHTVWLTR
ncbi:hypothetical protein [Lentzea sp. NPDC051838]|uniref:hypothetical protein n=1 Tax=Lentzea sp. NPDC051838 TaxID=3154849 RepID=UPI00344950B4